MTTRPPPATNPTRRAATLALGAAALGLAALATPALAFPDAPVTIVVPYAAGGGTDGAARAMAAALQKHWGKPVVVENVGGADGLIGTQKAARAKADGHTVVLSVPNLLLFKHMNDGGFDATRTLAPVSLVARYPVALIASKASGIGNFDDLKRVCGGGGTCSWGSGEQFSWLAGQSVLDALGLKGVVNVPFRGTGAVVTNVLGNHVTLGFGALAAPLPHYRSGSLQVVGSFAQQRSSYAPEVPTLDEAGVKGVAIRDGWYGLFAPKDTPAPALTAWGDALKHLSSDAGVATAFDAIAAQPVFSSSGEFATQVTKDEQAFDAQLKLHPLPR